MSRKNARDILFRLVFEYTFSKAVNDCTLMMFCSDATLDEQDKQYITQCYSGIADNYEKLCDLILKHSTGYTSLDRLVRADLTGMLISSYEMSFMPEIPAGVSINEAVELVKQYSTDKSSGFVNGVLASINKEICG